MEFSFFLAVSLKSDREGITIPTHTPLCFMRQVTLTDIKTCAILDRVSILPLNTIQL